MVTDTISDMLARISNAAKVGKAEVRVPYTQMCEAVARVMHDEKYLGDVVVAGEGIAKELVLKLQYVNGVSALSHLKRISKPGVRIYKRAADLKPVLSGLGVAILSTSKGVMSSKQAKLAKIGGEVLAELW